MNHAYFYHINSSSWKDCIMFYLRRETLACEKLHYFKIDWNIAETHAKQMNNMKKVLLDRSDLHKEVICYHCVNVKIIKSASSVRHAIARISLLSI